jgi:hypothetical protein
MVKVKLLEALGQIVVGAAESTAVILFTLKATDVVGDGHALPYASLVSYFVKIVAVLAPLVPVGISKVMAAVVGLAGLIVSPPPVVPHV